MSLRSIHALFAALAVAGCAESPSASDAFAPAVSNDGLILGQVVKVESGAHADLVLINAGYARNLRPGMKLLLSRQGKAIASLVVAEATQESAAALITDIPQDETVKPGDTVQATTASSLN